MLFRDVVDQFQNDDGLPDSRSAEATHLAAFNERANQVDDFDPGFENGGSRVLFGQRGSGAVDRVALGKRNRSAIIDRVACHIENTTQSPLAYWNGNRAARIFD